MRLAALLTLGAVGEARRRGHHVAATAVTPRNSSAAAPEGSAGLANVSLVGLFAARTGPGCLGGNGTLELQGCAPGMALGLRLAGPSVHTTHVDLVHVLTGARSELVCSDQSGDPVCPVPAAMVGRHRVTARVAAGDASGVAAGEAELQLQPPAKISAVAFDPQHCIRLGADSQHSLNTTLPWGCEPGSMLTLSGAGFGDTAEESAVTVPVHAYAPTCEQPGGGQCRVEHLSPTRLSCVLEYDDAGDDCGYPSVTMSLRTGQGMVPVPQEVPLFVLLPPVVTALSYSSGCLGGNGTLALRGCRNGTEITITGARLAATRHTTAVVLRGGGAHGSLLRCAVLHASAAAVRCRLIRKPGSFRTAVRASITVVSFPGRSQAPTEVEVLPAALLTGVEHAGSRGCTGGNSSGLDAGMCANDTVLVVEGSGLFGPVTFVSNVSECRCDALSDVVPAPDGDQDAGQRKLRCQLVCVAAPSGPVGMSLASADGQPDQPGWVVGFTPPPAVEGLAWREQGSGRCIGDGTEPLLTNCTSGVDLLVHGRGFDPAHEGAVQLLPVTRHGAGWRVAAAPTLLAAASAGPTTICRVDERTSGPSQLRCRLSYVGLPHPSADTYAVLAGGPGGLSVSPLLPLPPTVPHESGRSWALHAVHDALRPFATAFSNVPPQSLGTAAVPVVTLLPRPNVTRIDGCVRQLPIGGCLLKNGTRLTLRGAGLAGAELAPVECRDTVSDFRSLTCTIVYSPGSAIEVLLSAKAAGGVSGELPAALLPIPRIDSVGGCKDSDGAPLCRRDHRVTVRGTGFLYDNTAVRVVAAEDGAEAASSIVRVTEEEVVFTMLHMDATGLHDVEVTTSGGKARAAGVVKLRPRPALTEVLLSDGCLPPTSPLRLRRLQLPRRERQRRDGRSIRVPEPKSDDPALARACVNGGVLSIRGRNLGNASVSFLPTTHDGAEASGDEPSCHPDAGSNSTMLTCTLRHSSAAGPWRVTLLSEGGSAPVMEGDDLRQLLYPVPLPQPATISFGRKGHCLDGNDSAEVVGCTSGALITIRGAHFGANPRVLFATGKAGGTNGPPECLVVSAAEQRVICLLEHTSAAGGFEVTVSNVHGNSTAALQVAVIPGNLYLLFKNTQLVLTISNVVGWMSAVVWAGAIWALVHSCHTMKNVGGVAPDMILYNAAGLITWVFFCIFFHLKPEHGVPSTVQDCSNALVSYVAVLALVWEFRNYPGGGRITIVAKVLVCLFYVYALKYPIECAVGYGRFVAADFVPRLARVHLFCSVVKYLPQMAFNYQRKSTEGYSIGSVWLDLSGALLLLLQMFFDGVMRHKWSLMITLNVPKFALACLVCVCNSVYVVQHYVLYGPVPVPPRPKSCPSDADTESCSPMSPARVLAAVKRRLGSSADVFEGPPIEAASPQAAAGGGHLKRRQQPTSPAASPREQPPAATRSPTIVPRQPKAWPSP